MTIDNYFDFGDFSEGLSFPSEDELKEIIGSCYRDQPKRTNVHSELVERLKKKDYAGVSGIIMNLPTEGLQRGMKSFLLGCCELLQGQYDSAINHLDNAERHLKKPEVYTQRGTCFRKLDMLEKAVEEYDKSLRLNPDDAHTLMVKGCALAKQKKFDEAVQSYEKALRLEPMNHKIWYLKGFAHLMEGQIDEALKSMNAVTDINPDFATAWHSKGILLFNKYGSSRLDDSLDSLDKAIELDPDSDMVILYRLFNYAFEDLQRVEETQSKLVGFGGLPDIMIQDGERSIKRHYAHAKRAYDLMKKSKLPLDKYDPKLLQRFESE